MRIGRPRLESWESGVAYRVPVETRGSTSELWFRVGREHGDLLSDRADAALLGLILPAMKAGEDVEVEGAVSPRLLYHLSGPFQHAMQIVDAGDRCLAYRDDDVAVCQPCVACRTSRYH